MRDEQGRWVSGTSGNPNGRPRRGHSLADLIKVVGNQRRADGLTRKEALCAKLWEMAAAGSVPAMRLILDYVEGRPLDREPEPRKEMPPFTADEAAEAERRYRELMARLSGNDAGAELQRN